MNCKHTILALFLYSVIFSLPSIAQDESFKVDTNRISDIEIEEHFNKIGDMFTSERPNMSSIYNYADRYLADNFVMKRRIKTNDASKLGDIEEDILLKREDILQQFNDDRKILYDASLKHRILDIEHNKDKKTAKVTYTSLFKGHIKAMDKDNAWYSQEFATLSQCYDLLKMVNGTIKSFRAECNTEVIQKDPVKL